MKVPAYTAARFFSHGFGDLESRAEARSYMCLLLVVPRPVL
jgi:hypothetical protein